MLSIQEIIRYLPHRYPFILVDRIVELEAFKRVVGIKNVTVNEPFFQGHFPGNPVMPGVLILEAMAQVAGILGLHSLGIQGDQQVYFLGIDNARFRKPVVPGDQLRFEMDVMQHRGGIWRFKGVALVDGNKVAEAELLAMTQAKAQS
ncbi:MAG: 3-hydroxyacyl-ACP dehydratase FabZ [Candidatus Tectomicrobia bacterium]|uniref:3-hydroxyacyl-[acyl-carrier-protein] dehydratase FabZ n=1 Tax=Tectimicrobiota bacterium TaxID=2528274 RepID=A0A932CPS1_UNCTE|nr:3-hydroxyacyl-ACP dehydratase FabZ [Candidatus Tectomicrobia bacterium]